MCYRVESKPVRERPKKDEEEEKEKKKKKKHAQVADELKVACGSNIMQRTKQFQTFHSLRLTSMVDEEQLLRRRL